MASTCPKCHQTVEDEIVCCADVRYTWKCRACAKVTTGFVVPYGRCFMCGGETDVIENPAVTDAEAVRLVQEAAQFEIDMYQFYRLALARVTEPHLREVLENLYEKEQEHLDELESKYHLHFGPEIREPHAEAEARLSGWLFQGIRFEDGEHVAAVYDKALEMERRTRDHFRARAEALPSGPARDVLLELAAEEEEHVALLETEVAHLESAA